MCEINIQIALFYYFFIEPFLYSLSLSVNLNFSDNEEPPPHNFDRCSKWNMWLFLFFDDIIITFHTLHCIDHIEFITLYYISTIQLDRGFNYFTGSRINCLITARAQLDQSRVDKTCKHCKRACGTLRDFPWKL